MRLLFIAQRVPFPPDRGDRITTYHEICHLSRQHDVSLACLTDGKADSDSLVELGKLCTTVDAVRLRYSAARCRALSCLATGKPFTAGYFDEKELQQRVSQRVRQRR